MRLIVEESDYAEIRAVVDEELTFVPDDALIKFSLEHKTALLRGAYEYGWEDPQIVSILVELLEDNKKILDNPCG